MFEEITGRFETIFKKIRGQGRLTEENIAEAMRDVRRALLEADVNYRVAKLVTARVREKALGSDVLQSVTPGQQFVKIVHEELTELMGGEAKPVRLHTNRLNIVVMAGLQGSGKTTACAKLGLHFRRQGHRPVMIACDTHRAAAIDQLETLGKALDIPVFSDRTKSAQEICTDGLAHARHENYSLAIIDTAGRLHIDAEMMDELKEIIQRSSPDEIFFAADAMTGQDAVTVAAEFYKEISFSGIILTKMDGDARGGAALSVLNVAGVPIRFVGVGEKPDQLEIFHPDRMASRILGMGDIVSFVEKAQENLDLEKTRKLEKKLRKNAFTLQDFLDQILQIKKMGPIGDLMAMIPGMGNQLGNMDVDNTVFGKVEAIIYSMTRQERNKPQIIDASRKRRICAGSGTSVQEVNRLLKQFDTMRTMMKRMNRLSGKRGQMQALRSMFGT